MPSIRKPNITLAFDGDDTFTSEPDLVKFNAVVDIASGKIGKGANLTRGNDYADYVEIYAVNQCPMTTHLCTGRATSYAFWAKLLPKTGSWRNHMMASKLMRFRESSGNIQYHHWDLPDDTHKRLYQFTIRGFDTFDQWVHFVVTFRPDGTSDALHFYINGREMEIDVEVDPVQSGIRPVNRVVFGTSDSNSYNPTNVARWYFDEFHAWDAVLTPYEVSILYNSFPEE